MSMLRYVAPTRPRFTYTDPWAPESRDERGERRDETRRIVFRGSHGSGSTWIMPVPVRPTRTCPWNSRSRTRLDAHPSGLSAHLDYGRSLGGISPDEFSRFFFREGDATRPFYQPKRVFRRSSLLHTHACLILDIHIWQTRHYAHWWWFPTAYAE